MVQENHFLSCIAKHNYHSFYCNSLSLLEATRSKYYFHHKFHATATSQQSFQYEISPCSIHTDCVA